MNNLGPNFPRGITQFLMIWVFLEYIRSANLVCWCSVDVFESCFRLLVIKIEQFTVVGNDKCTFYIDTIFKPRPAKLGMHRNNSLVSKLKISLYNCCY